MAERINVTKPYMPPMEDYNKYLEGVWERGHITNSGPLVMELEKRLKETLGVQNIHFLSNGMIALQLALKALKIEGEVITTPFSYVATTTAVLWENCKPVFVDIEPKTYCIDADKIEAAITPQTSAILATHVYGYPCDVEKIEAIAQKHNLKVIYDGAHAFGVTNKGQSLFNYGDISTVSFHATKLYHTVEGGAVFTNDKELAHQMYLYRSFGHLNDDYFTMGVNAKNSEFHAAMGLCNLPMVPAFIAKRKQIFEAYWQGMEGLNITYPEIPENIEYNYAYFPVIFENEEAMFQVKNALEEQNIYTRRYFYPSLNQLPYHSGESCPVSEDIASRVLCLPLYYDLDLEDVNRIASIIKDTLK
jgi:dTDP-4-amino-4,6-dideoxygalactose transaminase